MQLQATNHGRDRAQCPIPILVFVVVVAAAFAATANDASAQSRRDGAAVIRSGSEFWFDRHALLEPVTSYDFEAGNTGRNARRSTTATATLTAQGALQAGFHAPPVGNPSTVVRREIDGLWRLRIRGSSSLPFTRVDYDVIGANGERGVLSHTSNHHSTIGVRVVELPLRQVGGAGNSGTVEGGVMLEMDLGRALEAGRYSGSIRVTVVQI